MQNHTSLQISFNGNLFSDKFALKRYPKHNKIREDSALYEDLVTKFYSLVLLMKSQKRIDSNNFDNKLLDFILAWNKAFLGKSYSNRLYFVMMHLPDFDEEYGICDRASGESHESVHAMLAMAREAMARMASTQQLYYTLFSRTMVSLKKRIAERKKIVYDRGTGKNEENTVQMQQTKGRIRLSSAHPSLMDW